MPLFEPKTLLKLVNDWYAVPHQRDPVSWAAINVVLALTYKQDLTGSSGRGGGDDLAAIHLSKAQSVISARHPWRYGAAQCPGPCSHNYTPSGIKEPKAVSGPRRYGDASSS